MKAEPPEKYTKAYYIQRRIKRNANSASYPFIML